MNKLQRVIVTAGASIAMAVPALSVVPAQAAGPFIVNGPDSRYAINVYSKGDCKGKRKVLKQDHAYIGKSFRVHAATDWVREEHLGRVTTTYNGRCVTPRSARTYVFVWGMRTDR
jgi:hypothetical protein